MYYTVIKQSVHLRTLEKYGNHLPVARVFYIYVVFSNACHGLSCSVTHSLLATLFGKYLDLAKPKSGAPGPGC